MIAPIEPQLAHTLGQVSFWALVAALASAGVIITFAMIKGMARAKAEARVEEIFTNG